VITVLHRVSKNRTATGTSNMTILHQFTMFPDYF